MASANTDSIVNRKERRKLVPYSDTHILRLEEQGQFPKRVQLGPGRVGWSLNEINAWIEARKKEREVSPMNSDTEDSA